MEAPWKGAARSLRSTCAAPQCRAWGWPGCFTDAASRCPVQHNVCTAPQASASGLPGCHCVAASLHVLSQVAPHLSASGWATPARIWMPCSRKPLPQVSVLDGADTEAGAGSAPQKVTFLSTAALSGPEHAGAVHFTLGTLMRLRRAASQRAHL